MAARKTSKGLGAASAAVLARKPAATSGPDGDIPAEYPTGAPKAGGIVAALQRGGEGLLMLRLDQVAPHPDNPRDSLGDLEPLAASIAELGQLQPALVVPADAFVAEHPHHAEAINGAEYVVAAGHRRRAAVELGGGTHLAAVVRPTLDKVDSYVTFIDENSQRTGLNPIEEARVYALVADAGLNQSQIAKKLRVSQGQVSKRLALLKLPQPVQDAVTTGDLPVAEALALTGVPPEDQLLVWETARERAWPLPTAVNHIERERADQVAIAKARKKAEKAGDPILEDPAARWNSHWSHRLYNTEQVEQARAEGTLLAHPSPAGLIYYTDKPKQSPRAEQERLDDRERKAANKARNAACAVLVDQPPGSSEALGDLARINLTGGIEFARCLSMAHKWLGSEVGPETDNMYEWIEAIREDGNDGDYLWVAWTMTVAQDENLARQPYRTWTTRERDHLDRLVQRTGYEPTPWESAKLHAIGGEEGKR